jgi:hypothetical protein
VGRQWLARRRTPWGQIWGQSGSGQKTSTIPAATGIGKAWGEVGQLHPDGSEVTGEGIPKILRHTFCLTTRCLAGLSSNVGWRVLDTRSPRLYELRSGAMSLGISRGG